MHLWVDRDTATLFLGAEEVLSAMVRAGTFEIDFGIGWQEELRSEELDNMFSKAKEKTEQQAAAEVQTAPERHHQGQGQGESSIQGMVGTAPIGRTRQSHIMQYLLQECTHAQFRQASAPFG